MISLSKDQTAVYKGIVDWLHNEGNLLTVGGYAGTGKSTLLAKLISDHPHVKFACCAFTGKAANVLSRKLGRDVSTIHRLIYKPIEDKNGKVTFERKKEVDLSADVIVIDEASMVSAEMLADLQMYDIPILAVGDHGQLPPVSGSSTLMERPMLRLEQIHRQAEHSPIIQLSRVIREEGRLPIPPPKGIRHLSMRMLKGELEERISGASSDQMLDFAMLCYRNATRVKLNEMARTARWGTEVYNDRPVQDDVVICLRNASPVYNGMRGVLKEIRRDKGAFDSVSIEFKEDQVHFSGNVVRKQFGREATYTNAQDLRADGIQVFDMRNVGGLYDYGYAMTVHKAQGSGFKTVYLVREKPSKVDDATWVRWAYTGVTRAIDELVLVAA